MVPAAPTHAVDRSAMHAADYHAHELMFGAMSSTPGAWPLSEVGTGSDGGMD